LRGPRFSETDASQALYLGANGVVENGIPNEMEEGQLQGILSRYIPIREKRKNRRYYLNEENEVAFLIAHPKDRLIITGKVQNISRGGISFCPDHIAFAGDISLHQELAECSLRVGKAIFSPVCRLTRIGTTLSLKFLSFPAKERAAFESSMEKLPLRTAKRRPVSKAAASKPLAGRVNTNRKNDG
ncbi:MAG: PilZ domain-containing protein, partial [Treponema sp.]|nr:PilZ domain-containing protein [Treponema sp.]